MLKFLTFILVSVAGSFAGASILRIGLGEVFPMMSYTDWLKVLFTLSVMSLVGLVVSVILALVTD